MDIGAKVYTLAMNSAVYRDLGNEEFEWIRNGFADEPEFVRLEDYEIALKRIIELETILDQNYE